MTRERFISDFRAEIDGWLLDAAMTHRTGADLSIWLRTYRAKIEAKLGQMYDALTKSVAVNGAPAPPTTTRTTK